MPIHSGYDTVRQKPYFQWGNHGAKYYFNPHSTRSSLLAYNKAKRQAIAVHSTGWREH